MISLSETLFVVETQQLHRLSSHLGAIVRTYGWWSLRDTAWRGKPELRGKGLDQNSNSATLMLSFRNCDFSVPKKTPSQPSLKKLLSDKATEAQFFCVAVPGMPCCPCLEEKCSFAGRESREAYSISFLCLSSALLVPLL